MSDRLPHQRPPHKRTPRAAAESAQGMPCTMPVRTGPRISWKSRREIQSLRRGRIGDQISPCPLPGHVGPAGDKLKFSSKIIYILAARTYPATTLLRSEVARRYCIIGLSEGRSIAIQAAITRCGRTCYRQHDQAKRLKSFANLHTTANTGPILGPKSRRLAIRHN
jgi:hypothetical protein